MQSLLRSTDGRGPALEKVAAALAGRSVQALLPVGRGANSRVYRVDAGADRFALKAYPRPSGDGRDRLGAEVGALEFFRRHGLSAVAGPVAADREAGFALFEWIEGEAITNPGPADIEAAAAFVERLHGLAAAAGAEGLPPAAEACLSGAEIAAQIERRRARLAAAAPARKDLADFLGGDFTPVFAAALARAKAGFVAAGWDFAADIGPTRRTLSPSDFGFHNAIRRPDGTLAFIDFEYFGWDDPVRLVADFLLHPGMELAPPLGRRFLDRTRAIYGGDENFSRRLDLLFPLVGLRWGMILLNEFLPEGWSRRTFAGAAPNREEVLARQMTKARRRLRSVENALNGISHAP